MHIHLFPLFSYKNDKTLSLVYIFSLLSSTPSSSSSHGTGRRGPTWQARKRFSWRVPATAPPCRAPTTSAWRLYWGTRGALSRKRGLLSLLCWTNWRSSKPTAKWSRRSTPPKPRKVAARCLDKRKDYFVFPFLSF